MRKGFVFPLSCLEGRTSISFSSLSLSWPMPGLVPGSGAAAAAAGPRLLSRLAVLFSRQMAAAGLGEGEGGGFEEEAAAIGASSSPLSRPRPPLPKQQQHRRRRRLAVAFSGGPDSAALGMLAGWWAGTARPPFAAVEEALRAERERAASSSSRPPLPPPLPLSLALERWWRRRESHLPGTKSCYFSASFLESEGWSEGENGGKGDEEEGREGEGRRPLLLPPLALVVDHGLRPGSRETALRAALLARSLGLEPLVLEAPWPPEEDEEGGGGGGGRHKKKRTTLEAARDARFAALLSAAAAAATSSGSSSPASISVLLLGHHADDQAETVALRLLRASGPAGLSGIPPRSWLQLPPPGTTTASETAAPLPPPPPLLLCLRPLLSVPKAALLGALSAAGVTGWARDPSNGDLGPPRNRLRALLAGAAAAEAAAAGGGGGGGGAPSPAPPPILTKLQERESRRAAAAANRLAAALRARRRRVESGAARALEAAKLQVAPSALADVPSPPSSSSRSSSSSSLSSPRFLLRLAPVLSAGEAAGKAALAAMLDAAAAADAATRAATTTPCSSSEAAAARLWGSVSASSGEIGGGRLRGAFTGARCVVRPVPGSKGRELVVHSVESDERERGAKKRGGDERRGKRESSDLETRKNLKL